MPFSPQEPCPVCWCCLEVACRDDHGGCHEDPDSVNGKRQATEEAETALAHAFVSVDLPAEVQD
jgi:hypothetical protein